MNVAIAGAAGYTAGELIRILLHHPGIRLKYLQSESHRGEPVGAVHTDLVYSGLCFTDIDFSDTDILFLCMGHGYSGRFLQEHPVPERVRIIDLGNDFRLAADAGDFVYGLPEWQRERIRTARHIANPGCFATAIELALLPLAAAGELPAEVNLFGITGSTGAGQRPTEETHFSLRSQNLSNYKVFTHQHLDEIGETLRGCGRDAGGAGFLPELVFVPVRGCHTRGILVNCLCKSTRPPEQLAALYREYYAGHPFVWVSDNGIYLKQVVNTNYCFLHLEQQGDRVLVTSVLDNLLKGASGQAVQNMNLMCGWEEDLGLNLKASFF